jgi:Divergent InlB B-repeat domain
MSQARSATANYVHQFQLTLATAPAAASIPLSAISGASNGDWFDAGTVVNLTAAQYQLQSGGSRYRFDHWSGDSSDTTLATSVTMSQARSATANYVHQFQLTLATAPAAIGTSHISGGSNGDWYDSGTPLTLQADSPVAAGSLTSHYDFQNWTGDVSPNPTTANPVSVTMGQARSITANYTLHYDTTLALTVTKVAPNASIQWSDPVLMSAKVDAADTTPGNLVGSVTFAVGGTTVATVAVNGAAPQTVTAQPTLNLTLLPSGFGTPAFTAVFTPSTGSSYLGSQDSKSPGVGKEDAAIDYTGDALKMTSSSTATSASVNLAAAITEASDGYLGGKLAGQTLKFSVYKSSNLTMTTADYSCTGTVTATGSGSGTAGCTLTLPLDNYTVKVELVTNNYYGAPVEVDAVTVAQPGNGFTTGGGWVTDPNLGTKSNFGFTVKYQKNGSVQGNSLYIYRRNAVNLATEFPSVNLSPAPLPSDNYNWIIKSNSWQGGGLTESCTTTTPTVCKATFSGKNTVVAVSRTTGVAYSLGGGGIYNYRVDVTDNGEPGSSPGAGPDTYGIKVWTSSGTYYQLGTATTTTSYPQLAIGGGNIQVRP